MVWRGPALSLFLAGCRAAPSPTLPAPFAAPASVAAPVTSAVPSAAPPPPPPVATVDDAAIAEPCLPPRAMPDPVCADARLAAILARHDADEPLDGKPRCRPLDVADLEEVGLVSGHAGDLSLNDAFLGNQDVDGDGRRDLVLRYTSVDYWQWFLFQRRPGCLRFVAAVEGYQVELLPSMHHGVRDLRVWTYPLQGEARVLAFDGSEYKPRARRAP
jgi:hypothetical protein